jgi:hypothetical protein
MYSVNTTANYDPSIIPLLHSPIGTALKRPAGRGDFVVVEDWSPEEE